MNCDEKRYEAYSNSGFYEFIIKAIDEEIADNKSYLLSKHIDDSLAKEIGRIVGFDVTGFANMIEPSEVRHIVKEHGKFGTTDQSMKNLHDLEKAEFVVENWDKVAKGKISKKYKNRDNTKSQTIVIQKKIGKNYYYIVEAVPNNAKKTLFIISAYINKNDTLSNVAVHEP